MASMTNCSTSIFNASKPYPSSSVSRPSLLSLSHGNNHRAPKLSSSSIRCLAANISSVLKRPEISHETVLSLGREDVASSATRRPTILVSEKLGEAGLELLRSFGNVECSYDLSPEQLCEKISKCDALIVRSGTKVTRRVLEAGKGGLKVVGRAGVKDKRKENS